MLNERQQKILGAIVEEYVRTAQPVASRTIAQSYDFGVSPATVRNDMAFLDNAGLVRQPHTSAGRVPTEKGYRLYLEQFVRHDHARKPCAQFEKAAQVSQSPNEIVRAMAECLTKMTGETALASLNTGWQHYSGISKLFEKPEFSDVQTLRALSEVVDRFDSTLRDIFGEIEDDVNVWIGDENPFGEQVATMMVKYRLPNGMIGTLGLIGPMRMNYEKNLELLQQAKKLLDTRYE